MAVSLNFDTLSILGNIMVFSLETALVPFFPDLTLNV